MSLDSPNTNINIVKVESHFIPKTKSKRKVNDTRILQLTNKRK